MMPLLLVLLLAAPPVATTPAEDDLEDVEVAPAPAPEQASPGRRMERGFGAALPSVGALASVGVVTAAVTYGLPLVGSLVAAVGIFLGAVWYASTLPPSGFGGLLVVLAGFLVAILVAGLGAALAVTLWTLGSALLGAVTSLVTLFPAYRSWVSTHQDPSRRVPLTRFLTVAWLPAALVSVLGLAGQVFAGAGAVGFSIFAVLLVMVTGGSLLAPSASSGGGTLDAVTPLLYGVVAPLVGVAVAIPFVALPLAALLSLGGSTVAAGVFPLEPEGGATAPRSQAGPDGEEAPPPGFRDEDEE